jgi:cytochrome c oxidase subunit 2
MARWGQFGFNDAASPIIEELIYFHDHAIIILILITTLIIVISGSLLINTYTSRYTREAQLIEIIWTVLPGIILIFLALPSLRLLYILDESYDDSSLILKVTGHQWYC